MTDRMTGALPDERLSSGEAMRALAAIAAITLLSGPRRTRPFAGFLYGLALSRAHGASLRYLEARMRGLFDQRASVHARLAGLERRLYGEHGIVDELDRRAGDLEVAIASQYHHGDEAASRLPVLRRITDRAVELAGASLAGRA